MKPRGEAVLTSQARVERAIGRFREVLKRRSLKATSERDAIVRAAMKQNGHFQIQELVNALKEEGAHDASIATVYRTIPLLIEAGILQATLLSGDQHRYEVAFEREHHDHLMCVDCGRVIEFQSAALEALQEELAEKYDFELTAHIHELIGRCGKCRKKGSDTPEPASARRSR